MIRLGFLKDCSCYSMEIRLAGIEKTRVEKNLERPI